MRILRPMLIAASLLPMPALADPPGPPPACGVSINRLFCYRITQTRKLPGDPQGDAWEIMFEFVNWTNQDVVGIDVAMNVGGLVQTQGQPPFFADAYIDSNGRPFGPDEVRPLGNQDLDNDWGVHRLSPNRLRYGVNGTGTPIPHPVVAGTVAGTPTTYEGVYDPQFANSTLPECSAAISAMIPGSTVSGNTINASPRTLDDGDNVRDGFVVVIDDFDPGETISFNWVLLVGDGTEISGYVDPSGTVQGDPMGFGTFSMSLYPNGLPSEPIFNVNAGFDPPNAFDPNQDDDYIWAENESGGVDQYPVNPIPGGYPGAGTYLGVELGAAVTAPFVESAAADGDGTFTFDGQPVTMGDNADPTFDVELFELDVPFFVLPGDPLTLRSTGAVPGDTVWFIYGPSEGPGPCPPQLFGDCVQVRDARAFGETIADANGVAILDITVPPTLPQGLSTLVQSVGIRNSAAAGQQINDNYRTDVQLVTLGVDPDNCDDSDGDSICDAIDLCIGDNATGDDDGDGLCADLDLCTGDNTTGDDDNDGVCNDNDQCAGNDALGDADNDGNCGAIDSDADGLFDIEEANLGTNPNDSDSDDDGLLDGIEVNTYGTNPLLADSDGGGVDDLTELTVDGTNPLDAADDLVVAGFGACESKTHCIELTPNEAMVNYGFNIPDLEGSQLTVQVGWNDVPRTCTGMDTETYTINSQTQDSLEFTVTADNPTAQAFIDGQDMSSRTLSLEVYPGGVDLIFEWPDLWFFAWNFASPDLYPGCAAAGPLDIMASGQLNVNDNPTVQIGAQSTLRFTRP